MMSILFISGVVLFISGSNCLSPIIISRSESSEINIETNDSVLQIDPDILEDAKLTTVSTSAIYMMLICEYVYIIIMY